MKERQTIMGVSRSSKRRSCIYYTAIVAVANMLLLSSLSVWLRPTTEQWLPKHLYNASRKDKVFVEKFPFRRANLNRTLRILLWTPWFGDPDWAEHLSTTFSSCPVSDCVLTKDKSHIDRVDAVLFHAMDVWNKFMGYPLPEYRRWDQVWVLVNQEPPPHTPADLRKYNGVFNWTATYRSSSDVPMPYFKTHRVNRSALTVGDVAATKSAGIAWVASNCGDEARRQLLVREINRYIKVDTYGACGEKALPAEKIDTVLKKYKFYLALENSYCRDYITEKFVSSHRRHTIPIVGGGGDYKTLAPPRSYIDVKDFNSVKELAEYLVYLDKNNTAYNRYFEWTKDYEMISTPKRITCELCEALHDERRLPQVYSDLAGYFDDDTCLRWTLPRYILRHIQGYAIKLGLV